MTRNQWFTAWLIMGCLGVVWGIGMLIDVATRGWKLPHLIMLLPMISSTLAGFTSAYRLRR